MAGVPKALLVGLVALLWVVSPIDLIPDAVPFLGALDDAIVSVLAVSVLMNALRSKRREPPGRGIL